MKLVRYGRRLCHSAFVHPLLLVRKVAEDICNVRHSPWPTRDHNTLIEPRPTKQAKVKSHLVADKRPHEVLEPHQQSVRCLQSRHRGRRVQRVREIIQEMQLHRRQNPLTQLHCNGGESSSAIIILHPPSGNRCSRAAARRGLGLAAATAPPPQQWNRTNSPPPPTAPPASLASQRGPSALTIYNIS